MLGIVPCALRLDKNTDERAKVPAANMAGYYIEFAERIPRWICNSAALSGHPSA